MPPPSLSITSVTQNQHRPNDQVQAEVTGVFDNPKTAGVGTTKAGFQFVDPFHRPYLGASGNTAPGKHAAECLIA